MNSFFIEHCTLYIVLIFLCLGITETTFAQKPLRIARIQPDALAPGMTIALEVLAMESDSGAFGKDGVWLPYGKIILERPSDSTTIILGPVVTSWKGRMLQIPAMVPMNAPLGIIRFRVKIGNVLSALQSVRIVSPQPTISIVGGTILGDPINGTGLLTEGNTLVVDGIELTSLPGFSPKTTFSVADPDTISGNLRYHPMTILSRGPIIFKNIELSVSADSLDGGPGGGGGGGGFVHSGGAGYTGGGSDSDGFTTTNVGSGSNGQSTSGGFSTTHVRGGQSDLNDQGGGGGTGAPFGTSGDKGNDNNPSRPGGFGGASAGGETLAIPYGGGGGGFTEPGQSGGGPGSNQGTMNGGRFLSPMQGGSGGGAGNSIQHSPSAGSGGGGGGAVTIIGFDTVMLTGTSLNAKGSNGISGTNVREAGGGGGSGGSVLLSSRKKLGIENSSIDTRGGKGGDGGAFPIDPLAKGGSGGFGAIRIDADVECASCSFVGMLSSGVTLYEQKEPLKVEFGKVEGFGGGESLDSSIRIYYRSSHSSWKSIDTIRFKDNARFGNRYHWEKLLPLGYDAEMYVTVMVKVASPERNFANYEPEWLISHLSSGIIPVVPRPHLVFSSDTVNFGCIKMNDSCIRRTIYFSNEGGKSAVFDSVTLGDTMQFHIISQPTETLPYSNDSIIIKFCAQTRHDTTNLSFVVNGKLHMVTLIGCGVETDSRLTIIPNPLNFGRVRVGVPCDTLIMKLLSIGKDTAFFDPSITPLSPFTILSPITKRAIAPNDTLKVTVSFCPKDTGTFRASFIVNDRRDMLNVIGVGTRKLLRVTDSLDLGRFCAGGCVVDTITVTNISNDSVTITSLLGAKLISNTPPLIFPPYFSAALGIRICSDSGGTHTNSIRYNSNADNTFTTKLHYVVTKTAISITGDTSIGPVCVKQCDTTSLVIHNVGSDSITISSTRFTDTNEFKITQPPVMKNLGVRDSMRLPLSFCPALKGERKDTLHIRISSFDCDTMYSLVITGIGAEGGLFFSLKKIIFGVVDTGKCAVDSLIVSNQCGANATLDIPTLSPPFSVLSPTAAQISLGTNEQQTIIYQYCPTTEGADSAIHILDTTRITLRGIGKVHPPLPTVTFSVPAKKNVTEGTTFDYSLNVDEISANASIESFFVVLRYDPVVIAPLFITSQNGWQITGNETKPGRYEISGSANTATLTSGKIADIKILPYLAMRDTASVIFESAITVPEASVTKHSGSIFVLHCGELPKNIIIAGDYEVGDPSPNPMSTHVSIPLKLGADGLLTINVANTNGDIVLQKILPRMKKGKQTLQLDLSSLVSGSYFITFDSWGWRETRSVLITK